MFDIGIGGLLAGRLLKGFVYCSLRYLRHVSTNKKRARTRVKVCDYVVFDSQIKQCACRREVAFYGSTAHLCLHGSSVYGTRKGSGLKWRALKSMYRKTWLWGESVEIWPEICKEQPVRLSCSSSDPAHMYFNRKGLTHSRFAAHA